MIIKLPTDIKVGTKVWVARREYECARRGVYGLDSFWEGQVDGENRINWLIGPSIHRHRASDFLRINKKTGECEQSVFFDKSALDKDIEDVTWAHTHRWRVRDALDRVKEVDTIRQVAALIGYDETTKCLKVTK